MGMHMVVTMIDQLCRKGSNFTCTLMYVAKVDLALEKIEEQKYESDVK